MKRERLVFLGYLGLYPWVGRENLFERDAEPCIHPAQDALDYGDRVCYGGFESFKPL